MILSFFKRFFSRKNQKTMNETINTNNTQRKHKLEIQIFEADYTDVPDGQPPRWKSVRMEKPVVIEVKDEKEFSEIKQQYALCDQRIQVIREIDPFDEAPKTVKSTQASTSTNVEPINQVKVANQAQQSSTIGQTVLTSEVAKPKPKIITVGDTQIKYDGEKVYSRQWVKLNAKEASCIRVVNDSNNKIFQLNGKHLEALRWVLVENDSTTGEDDISSSIESIISGN